jgi:hypothetical protein
VLFLSMIKVKSLKLFWILHFHVIILERAFPYKLRLLLILIQVGYEGWVKTELLIFFIFISSASSIISTTSWSLLILLNELSLILPQLITFLLVKEIYLVSHHHHIFVKVEFIVDTGNIPILLILLFIFLKLSHFAQIRLNVQCWLSWCYNIIKHLIFTLPHVFTVKSESGITLIPILKEGIAIRQMIIDREVSCLLVEARMLILELAWRGGILELWIIQIHIKKSIVISSLIFDKWFNV